MKSLSDAVKFIKKHGYYPNPPVVSSPHAPEIVVNGEKVLMFATNNYLDLMTDPRVIESAVEGVRKWGIGNGSARLLTGNLEIHNQLEEKIAAFKHREAALTFVSGYMANSGTIPALVNVPKFSLLSLFSDKIAKDKDTILFSDELNHASAIAGMRLSGAHKEIYKHLDVDDLKEKLERYPVSQRKLIVTDGVFSMDGDIAPLPAIIDLAKKYGAILYVDDAHGTGILGPHGRGVEDYFNVEGASDILMGTFTKAFGGVGGFVVGSKDLIDYLRITADTFIFTAPIAPPVVCGLMKSIEIAESETWRRETVLSNAAYLKEKLSLMDIDFLNSKTQIVPILIGDEKKAIAASEKLLEHGIFIPAARWPAVSKGKARLRTTVSASHTKDQIDQFIGTLKIVKNEVGF